MPVRGLFEPLGRYIFAQIPSMTVITKRNIFLSGSSLITSVNPFQRRVGGLFPSLRSGTSSLVSRATGLFTGNHCISDLYYTDGRYHRNRIYSPIKPCKLRKR